MDHEYNTWRKPENKHGHLWLQDTFSKVQENARIFLYKYNSSPAFGTGKDSFVREANQLLESIYLKRSKLVSRLPWRPRLGTLTITESQPTPHIHWPQPRWHIDQTGGSYNSLLKADILTLFSGVGKCSKQRKI
jgi:hypothetical protein